MRDANTPLFCDDRRHFGWPNRRYGIAAYERARGYVGPFNIERSVQDDPQRAAFISRKWSTLHLAQHPTEACARLVIEEQRAAGATFGNKGRGMNNMDSAATRAGDSRR